MTQRTDARPAGLGRAEAIVMLGLCLLVVAVVVSWMGGGSEEEVSVPAPSTRPEVILEPLSGDEKSAEVYAAPSSDAEKWDFGGGGNTAGNWSSGFHVPATASVISGPTTRPSAGLSAFDSEDRPLLPTD